MTERQPPVVLIIDDVFGRIGPEGRNLERENLCGQFLLADVTDDEAARRSTQQVLAPVARAIFARGQTPSKSTVGDVIENDLSGVLRLVRDRWPPVSERDRLALVLVDLCFYTGRVTVDSDRRTGGMPAGSARDEDPRQYFGLRILEALQQEFPDLPVAVLSSKSRDEVSRDFSMLGAVGFVPRDVADGPELLRDFLWWHGLIQDDSGQLLGRSTVLLTALRAARRAAKTNANVLIRGERGSGKELLARYIHGASGGAERPFVVVNSAVLTPDLFASELFGIERGVATGVAGRTGRLRSASGGDLFLDEIRDMVPQAQAGILRVLEDRRVVAVGGVAEHAIDVRVLSATNIDIESLAASGAFRSDLLDRLRDGGAIYLPALRDRLEDIPLLAEKFVRDAEAANPRAVRRRIDGDAIALLQAHDWPGNIRELRSAIFRAVSNYPDVEHLVPLHVPDIRRGSHLRSTNADARPLPGDGLEQLLDALRGFEFDASDPREFAGRYGPIRNAFAAILAGALEASLGATRRTSVESPGGEISIHAAGRLLTGDTSMTAVQAADLVKRIAGTGESVESIVAAHPLLREAIETALRLRPRNRKNRQT